MPVRSSQLGRQFLGEFAHSLKFAVCAVPGGNYFRSVRTVRVVPLHANRLELQGELFHCFGEYPPGIKFGHPEGGDPLRIPYTQRYYFY